MQHLLINQQRQHQSIKNKNSYSHVPGYLKVLARISVAAQFATLKAPLLSSSRRGSAGVNVSFFIQLSRVAKTRRLPGWLSASLRRFAPAACTRPRSAGCKKLSASIRFSPLLAQFRSLARVCRVCPVVLARSLSSFGGFAPAPASLKKVWSSSPPGRLRSPPVAPLGTFIVRRLWAL